MLKQTKWGMYTTATMPPTIEVARVEAFRSLGFPYKKLEEMGIGMPVLSLNVITTSQPSDLLTS